MSPAGDWQTGCLWWEVVESRFHADLKSNFALNNNSMEILLGLMTGRINVLYESRMKWTWPHPKLAVEEVSFFGGLRVVLLQLLSIHVRAVDVTNLGVLLLWSQAQPASLRIWQEAYGVVWFCYKHNKTSVSLDSGLGTILVTVINILYLIAFSYQIPVAVVRHKGSVKKRRSKSLNGIEEIP